MASGTSRLFTGLTGLPVSKNPHKELFHIYQKVLRHLEKLPEDSNYRITTEKLYKERNKLIASNTVVDSLEKQLNAGLCEEMIARAKHELKLIEIMQKFKPWEPLEEKPLENQWKWPL